MPINNNVSEREMKRVALNRNNRLFIGNERHCGTAAPHTTRFSRITC